MDEWFKIGIPTGLFVTAIIWLATTFRNQLKEGREEREKLEQSHRSEREDWKRTIERQFDEAGRNINRNTEVLTELKTLLRNRE